MYALFSFLFVGYVALGAHYDCQIHRVVENKKEVRYLAFETPLEGRPVFELLQMKLKIKEDRKHKLNFDLTFADSAQRVKKRFDPEAAIMAISRGQSEQVICKKKELFTRSAQSY